MRFLTLSFLLGTLLLLGSDAVDAKGKGKDKPKVQLKLKVGDPAPAFLGADEAGKKVDSKDLIGGKIAVLFFYPADFTGNAVAQARGYQDQFDSLTKGGAVVLGVSGDSPATHQLFKAYYKLPFHLLADDDGAIAKAFGIPVGKGAKTPTIDAKGVKGEVDRAVTIERVTIIIDKAGKIAAIDAVSKSPGDDAKRVADIVKSLESK
jgi:peroxiredoxin Q/BCP